MTSPQTFSTLQSFFLAMALHPDVQKKAQAELDSVVGHDRFPTHADRPDLPYIEAVAKESLRWHNVLPSGVSHSTSQDMVYDGYFIPAGTILMPNTWYALFCSNKNVAEQVVGHVCTIRLCTRNPPVSYQIDSSTAKVSWTLTSAIQQSSYSVTDGGASVSGCTYTE